MAVDSEQVTVGTSAQLLSGGDTDVQAGQSVLVTLPSGATASVFLGGSDVTTSGYELTAGTSVTVDLGVGDALHGIVTAGTETVHVLRVGV